MTTASFVPETQEEKKTEKAATPEHIGKQGCNTRPDLIAAKFKEAPSEKCRACGKTVYLAEKLVVPDLKQQHIYHKNCLRCTKCDMKLDLSNYGTDNGRIFCKVHLKVKIYHKKFPDAFLRKLHFQSQPK